MDPRGAAIVGMACVFPKAPDLAAYWRNVLAGVDAITDVPAQRWDPVFFDPASSAPDRFYVRKGGFVDEFADFDAGAFGIMPVAARGAEPEQLLALQCAAAALKDAGYADRDFPRARASVILGRGNYIGAATSRLINITRGAQQLVESLAILLPELGPGRLAELKREFQSRCGVYGPDTAIGLVPNLLASRIANRLDLRGAAYTLDAACASALVAVDHARRELEAGTSDLVLTGGVHLCHDLVFWSVFCQLGALSRSERIRPFDRRADGILMGEGIGLLVLKRLEDAQRDGDRIYAVLRGTGVSSDGRDVSLMLPSVEGQVLALERAWRAAGLEPASAGLVEAHGTATPAGDAAELETLRRVFGPADPSRERSVLGSVKSMIGHAMPAAGAAGLIKAALAAYHGVRPPTLHCEEPHAALDATAFRTLSVPEPWEAPLRRAAVNAFGFGGVNAHVVLEAPAAARADFRAPVAEPPAPAALLLAAEGPEALLAALDAGGSGGTGPCRLAILEPTPARLASARKAVRAGKPRHGRDGVHFSPRGLLADGGKVAFLYPGVEAGFEPDLAGLPERFGLEAPDFGGEGLAHQGAGVILLNHYLARVAAVAGLRADMVAGHSVGEWSAMIEAGLFEAAALQAFLAALEPSMLRVADVAYLAVGAGADRVGPWLEDLEGVAVSHDNCLHQSILCGPEAALAEAARRLREHRVLCETLPFRSGFHTRALEGHVEGYLEHLDRLEFRPAALPLWSATTCRPYPAAASEIRALFREHLLRPVRFRELLLALHGAGARAFVQVGTGSLAAFASDTLAGLPHLAVSLQAARRGGLEQLQRACAALWVEGAEPDLARVGLASKPARPLLRLELGVPMVRMPHPPLARSGPRSLPAGLDADPVLRSFQAALAAVDTAGEEVLAAYAGRPAEGAPSPGAAGRVGVAGPAGAGVPAKVPVLPSEVPGPASGAPGSQAPASGAEPEPGVLEEPLVVGLDRYPELLDHSLIPQAPGWPVAADRAPAAPMTLSIALLLEAAARFRPGRLPVAVERVAASTWLRADPPTETRLRCEALDADRVRVRIEGHVEGVVTLADRYPEAPGPSREGLGVLGEFPVPMEAVYRDGWLFHGPGYQGIASIDACGERGMRGTLRALPAKGALLDNAGQLLGLWVMHTCSSDQLAMPVRVGRIEFYGPDPVPGEMLDCTVWVRSLGRREVRADLDLVRGGRLWARITGWEDWRFFTGGPIFDVMRQPGRYLLAAADPEGFTVLEDPGWTTATLEFLMRRFFSFAELEAMGGLKQAQRRADWMYGRIAAKDAVRRSLFQAGAGEVFPLEIGIVSEASGRPRVTGRGEGLRVSIAHKPGIAVALAVEDGDPGIDVEEVAPRGDGFAALAFTPEELALLPRGDRDEWLTRFWCAKEAVGKARGTGLGGDPRSLRVEAVEAEAIMVSGSRVQTRRRGSRVVAWTIR
ncbi:MAG: beta-ketoacyl synthase N-terminal-like domain-containing protein [Holophagaceae bacterium]